MGQELLLVNPSDGLETIYEENPKRRRRRSRKRATKKQLAARRKFVARYGGGKRRRRRSSSRRRSRRSGGMESVVYRTSGRPVSRRSWKASGYRRNPRRRRSYSRRYRRNPIGGIKFPTMRGVQRTVTEALQGAIGATLVDMVMGQLNTRGWLPSFSYTQYGYPLTKGALAIATAAVAEAFVPRPLRGIAAEMAKGSITITLAGMIRQFVPDTLPLGARPMRRMGYGSSGYIPSARPRRAMMGEYLSGASATEERRDYYPSWDSSMGEYLSRR